MADDKHKAATHNPVRSMTGFGRGSSDDGRVSAEIRAVNGRYFKLNVKSYGRYGSFEDRVRAVLNERGIKRGSIDVNLTFESAETAVGEVLNFPALEAYAKQAHKAAKKLKLKGGVQLASLLTLPGAVKRPDNSASEEDLWPVCQKALEAALADFNGMRQKEGAAIADDIRSNLAKLIEHRTAIMAAAPEALKALMQRFSDRINKLIEERHSGASFNNDVIERELVLAADRTDVSEELARLESHYQQIENTLKHGGETGKKLDFLTQELFRETNTIGSKTSDEKITYRVVDMKGLIEKIREQVQNLE